MFERDYVIRGKHATYARFLSSTTERLNKNAKVASVFNRIVDVYMVAPLIGAAYKKKADEDSSSSESVRIFADAIINQQENLDSVFRLVMLSDNMTNLTNDEKISRAFKEDEDPIKLSENLEVFHQYMRGGIEWLYEQFTDGATTQEDYLAKVNEVVQLYKADFNEEATSI